MRMPPGREIHLLHERGYASATMGYSEAIMGNRNIRLS